MKENLFKIAKRTVSATLAVTMLCAMLSGCKKTIRISSEIDGTGESEYIIDWSEDTVSDSSVLNSNAALSGSNQKNGSSSSSSAGPALTPKTDYDVYANIPKNVKKIKILTWYTPDRNEKKVIDAFEKKFGIEVKITSTDTASYLNKLTTLVASNDAPDAAGFFRFPTPAVKNLFETINVATSDKGGAINLEKDIAYDKSAMESQSWKGNYYAVQLKGNWFADRPVTIYNKTLFKNKGIEDPGSLMASGKWNWTTFEAAAKAMTYKNEGIQIYGCGSTDLEFVTMLSATTGTNMVSFNNASGTIINNTQNPQFIKGIEFVTRLRSSGYCIPRGSDWHMFTNGQCAMWITGASQVKKGREFDSMSDEWSATFVPCPEGQKIVIPYYNVSWGFPLGAKNPVAASYFVRWLLDSSNWDIRATFSSDEMYNNWLAQQNSDYQTCMWNIGPFLSISPGLSDSLVTITWGNINDVSTGLKSISGSVDNAIASTVNQIKVK